MRNKEKKRSRNGNEKKGGQSYEIVKKKAEEYEALRKQEGPRSPNSVVTVSYVSQTDIAKVSHNLVNERVSSKMDYFSQLRAFGNDSTTLNPLEKAAVHAAQYLAMDPIEKMTRQVEQTVEAKLSLLQTKLENANDPKNKTQRKIYVGNLTSNINGEFLRQLFTQTLLISYPQWNVPGEDCVVEVQYRDGNKYCFLEFRTMDMAIAALQVNGVTVLGTQLQVSRPTGFLDPIECERAVKEAEQELNKFRSGEDDRLLLKQPGYTELVAKIKGYHLKTGQRVEDTAKVVSTPSLTHISLDGILTPSTMNSDDKVRKLYESIKDKIGGFSYVTRLLIPRPPLGIDTSVFLGGTNYSKILVQLTNLEAVEEIKMALHDMTFVGKKAIVQTVTEAEYLKALGI